MTLYHFSTFSCNINTGVFRSLSVISIEQYQIFALIWKPASIDLTHWRISRNLLVWEKLSHCVCHQFAKVRSFWMILIVCYSWRTKELFLTLKENCSMFKKKINLATLKRRVNAKQAFSERTKLIGPRNCRSLQILFHLYLTFITYVRAFSG